MKTKYLIGFIVVSLALIGSVAWAQAQNVQYPVKELGSCKDESSCKSYCDKPENTEACVSFGEKNNMMSKEEVGLAKKFIETGSKGPGGCDGKDQCENFCNDIANIDQCVAFAEKNDLMSAGELDEAKKVQAAIKRGVKPPPCSNKKQCDVYCEESEHMEECIAFGVEAGFIQGKELEDVQKMLVAIKKGVKPPPCKGKDACDAYCSSPDNIEVCMAFAKAAGFMTPEEEQNSEKMIAAVKKGVKPPNCKGKEACDAYCSEDAHVEECINFSIAAGFMSEKDAEMAKKTKGKGPGGCKGKDECEAFCNNPENQKTCFNFAKENGMISEEDLKQMEEGRPGAGGDIPPGGQERQGQINERLQPWKDMCENDTELACADDAGKFVEDAKIGGDNQPVCPTGSTAKCGNYPQMQQDKSGDKFQPGSGTVNPGGQQMPQQAGPGGCKGPEECKAYCESNPEECKNFGNNNQQQNQQGQNQQGQSGQPGQNQPGPGTNSQQMMQPPINQQPPSIGPGMGGEMAPGVFVPMQPQIEQTAPAPEGPAPAPEPQTLLKYSPFGAILNFFLGQ
ncbi:MAG: hypothetical protein Q7S78_01080 [Candidatus Azambacteria bacterium]|nr:hypothetical protein [Candidatus Azambacteria bacterium]